MFSSCSPRTMVEREARKKTVATCLTTAREKPIWLDHGKVNWVRRIGAFSWGKTKKLPWDKAVAAELASCLPAKAEFRKEGRSLARRIFSTGNSRALNGCRGGITRPSQRLAGCRCGYTRFSATVLPFRRTEMGTAPFGSPRKAGATPDPRHGCAVNTTESASRLARLHEPQGVVSGLNGWGTCVFSRTYQ